MENTYKDYVIYVYTVHVLVYSKPYIKHTHVIVVKSLNSFSCCINREFDQVLVKLASMYAYYSVYMY